jgi:hypothetical protein
MQNDLDSVIGKKVSDSILFYARLIPRSADCSSTVNVPTALGICANAGTLPVDEQSADLGMSLA